ncbi:hypothetical protein F4604DRAFT_1569867 [Suillus subluteus]|nr:hypothetical protein F4604DRAFT_1569867 [Suillus subluteus]
MLDLPNLNSSLMAFICPSLPETIHLCLTSSLLACFESKHVLRIHKSHENIKDHNSERAPQDAGFALENLGDNAHTHIHPHDIVRVDVSCTNHMQCLSYPSRDILEHQELYNNILTTFGELFEWIELVMKELLPEEYDILVELGQNLLGREHSPVTPFLSLILNLNVTMEGHRDRFDKDLCLILLLGEFAGGALVMFEQGLVLEIGVGDWCWRFIAVTLSSSAPLTLLTLTCTMRAGGPHLFSTWIRI